MAALQQILTSASAGLPRLDVTCNDLDVVGDVAIGGNIVITGNLTCADIACNNIVAQNTGEFKDSCESKEFVLTNAAGTVMGVNNGINIGPNDYYRLGFDVTTAANQGLIRANFDLADADHGFVVSSGGFPKANGSSDNVFEVRTGGIAPTLLVRKLNGAGPCLSVDQDQAAPGITIDMALATGAEPALEIAKNGDGPAIDIVQNGDINAIAVDQKGDSVACTLLKSAGTGAVALLDQRSAGEAVMEVFGTGGADVNSTISTFTTPGAVAGWFQVAVDSGGGAAKRWVPFYNDPTP